MQLWRTPFWTCFRETCLTSAIDDRDFVKKVFQTMVNALLVDPERLFLSGYSNGAMLVADILCAQQELAGRLRGVALISGALGKSFAATQCQKPARTSMMVVHGSNDPKLYFNRSSYNLGIALHTGGEARLV